MNILETLYQELTGFFGGLGNWWRMVANGNYSSLLTVSGIMMALGPVIPLLLVAELARSVFYKQFKVEDYKVPFFIYVFNRLVARFISIAAVVFCIGLFTPLAVFKTSVTWYWFIYAYVVWELAHYVYHFLGHKVRLFWCLHSTHHAPQTMNMTVNYVHFFLETPFADAIRTSICILLGVHPALLILIMVVDGVWGGFIHIGEQMLKDGRLGSLHKYILTPSHHRVHHARNPLYMDTNFCNLINIWDRLLGTLQHEDRSVPPEYGITRKTNPNSFIDIYFGEFVALARDVYHAPGFTNKLRYIFYPPGWNHRGEHQTAKKIRSQYLQQTRNNTQQTYPSNDTKAVDGAVRVKRVASSISLSPLGDVKAD